MRLGVGAAERRGHIGIHELHLAVAVVGAVEGELHLQALCDLELRLDVELVGARPYGRRSLSVVGDEPAAVEGTLYVVLVGETEGEVEARRHWAGRTCLAEDIAYVGAEKRQRQ